MKEAKYSKAFTVALEQEVFEQIKRITDEKRISMAEWVRDAVDAALNNTKREEDIM
jgi:predicted HicB family RNase H-like nuclease